MDDLAERYYRDSGAVPFGGTLLMLGCGGVAAVVLSFVYAFVDFYNPFVYVTFIGTAVFGLGVGGAITFGATLGKVRNPLFARLVGLLIGCFAMYLCWAFYLWAASKDGLSFDASLMWSQIQFLGDNGSWSMFGGTPKGWGLYSLWLLEAAIIVGAAVLLAGGSDSPFCEPCNEWTDGVENLLALENADFEQLCGDLEAERYERLDELHTGEHDPADCMQAALHTCPKCDESNYLTIKHAKVTIDKDGDEQTDETDVVDRLVIPTELVSHLTALAQNKPVVPQAEDVEGFDEPGDG